MVDFVDEQSAQHATGFVVARLLHRSKEQCRVDRLGDTKARNHLVRQPRRPVQIVGSDTPGLW